MQRVAALRLTPTSWQQSSRSKWEIIQQVGNTASLRLHALGRSQRCSIAQPTSAGGIGASPSA